MLAAIVLVVLGLALVRSGGGVVHARRFGPVTDGSRSDETGGVAFRLLGLLLVGVGVAELVGTHAPW